MRQALAPGWGIPIGASLSNASLKGAYNAVYLNFPQAAAGQARQAFLPLPPDGAGGFGAVTATGSATGVAGLTTQTIAAATYALSGNTGSINFGAPAANQLIGGTQSFLVSADGNLLVGGTAGGYDLLLASPAAARVTSYTTDHIEEMNPFRNPSSRSLSLSLSLSS